MLSKLFSLASKDRQLFLNSQYSTYALFVYTNEGLCMTHKGITSVIPLWYGPMYFSNYVYSIHFYGVGLQFDHMSNEECH